MDTLDLRPYRTDTTVEKWDNGTDPQSDPPTETVTVTAWFDAAGTPVTDAARIAEIETDIAARAAQQE